MHVFRVFKGKKGYLFYNHKNNKMFVSTHAKFFEDDYENNFNPRNKVVLTEINEPINLIVGRTILPLKRGTYVLVIS